MVTGAGSPVRNILSFILFQASWWGLFLAAKQSASPQGYFYVVGMFLITGVFLFLQRKYFSTDPRKDVSLAKKSFLFGLGVDGPIIMLGFITPGPALGLLSSWQQLSLLCLTLIFLWVIFSMTLNASLRTVRSNPYAFIILCGLFGPVTYLATEKLNFLKYSEPHLFSVGLHAALWASWGWFLAVKKEKAASR